MKQFYLLATLTVILTSATNAQLPISYYDFENSTHTTFQNQVELQVNNSNSSLTNTNGTLTNGNGAGISYGGTVYGKAIEVYLGNTSSSTDSKTSATHYQQFTANTSGFSGIGVQFDVLANSTSSEKYGVSYSTNGSSWTWVASVGTPGSNDMPWSVGDWNTAQVGLPAAAANKTALYIRIYEYASNGNTSSAHLRFDNLQVTALSTVAGAGTKNMLSEYSILAGCKSGAETNYVFLRNQFTVDGAGTIVNIGPFYFSGIAGGAGGNLTVSNNAVLNLLSNTYNHHIDDASGTVPVSVINILSGGTINMSNDLNCAGNIVLTNGTLNLNSQTLKMGGTITRTSGLINGALGTIDFIGTTGAQQIAGSFFSSKKLYNLKNSNTTGVTIASTANDTLRLLGTVSFGNVNNSTITTGDNLTLVSNAAGSAGVADITNSAANSGNSISGKVTVEKYIASGKKWHLLSIPTNTTQTYRQAWQENNLPGANATPGFGMNIYNNGSWAANGFDYAAGAPTVKIFNATTQAYVGITSTLIAMNTTTPHMVYLRGDRSITASSVTTSSTVLRSSGTLKQNTQPDVAVPANKFASVSNPYAAAVDMRKISKSAGVQDFFYVWDPKLGGTYGLGAFQTFSKSGSDYIVTPGGGSYGSIGSVNNFIKSGQGFFVRGASGGGTITFKEDAKASGTDVVSTARLGLNQMLRANLYVVAPDTTLMADGIMATFDDSASNDVDSSDALKIANGSENLSLKRSETLLSIESHRSVSSTDTLFLNLTGLRVQDYKWALSISNMDANGLTAIFVDSYLNTTTPLNMNGITELNFSIVNIPGSYAANRFMIVFQQAVVLPVTLTGISAIRTSNANIAVNFYAENEINLQQYELEHSSDAANFSSVATIAPKATNGGSANYFYNDTKPFAGDNFYRVKAISTSGRIQYSAIVKVAPVKTAAGINIYPNPVVDKKMNIQFSNQAAGKYNLVLNNQAGQVLFSSTVEVNNINTIRTVSLNSSIAPGNYELVIFAADGTKTVQQVVIL